MTTRIFKYEIPAPVMYSLPSVLELPVGAKFLTVGSQSELVNEGDCASEELIYLWAEVSEAAPTEAVYFMPLPTGCTAPINATHVGSAVFKTTRLVFHIYRLNAGDTVPRYN